MTINTISFDMNEQLFLNQTALDKNKDQVQELIDFTISISLDEHVISLMSGLKEKIENISIEDWDCLQKEMLPFETTFSAESIKYDNLPNEND